MHNNMIWFNRKFEFVLQPDVFPMIVERLRGTPARLEERVAGLPTSALIHRVDKLWTIKEQIGHLLDLEELWFGRTEDFLNGVERLSAADLENRKTHEANHNQTERDSLLSSFRKSRLLHVEKLDRMTEHDVIRTALHPRLEQSMRMLDHVWFIAEHDDHHLAVITKLMDAAN